MNQTTTTTPGIDLDIETLWEIHGVVKNAGSTRLAHQIADFIARRASVSQISKDAAGWKWVPVEPTEAMVHAGEDVEPPRPFGKVYRAMLAAAPVHAAAATSAEQALADMEARKDAAYYERNQVVAALAKCFPSGVARTAIEGWSEDWHGCVYIDLPTGQVSWHFHDSQAHLFADLLPYAGKWDGHDTPEKYRRVAALEGSAGAAAKTEQPDDRKLLMRFVSIITESTSLGESRVYNLAESLIKAASAAGAGSEQQLPAPRFASVMHIAEEFGSGAVAYTEDEMRAALAQQAAPEAPALSRATDGQQGASLEDLIGPQRWSKESEMMESWAHIGQQGASRAALTDNDEWRVGEFWSSASPGKKVLMLSRADQIGSDGAHKDFIRWIVGSSAALARAPLPAQSGAHAAADDAKGGAV